MELLCLVHAINPVNVHLIIVSVHKYYYYFVIMILRSDKRENMHLY